MRGHQHDTHHNKSSTDWRLASPNTSSRAAHHALARRLVVLDDALDAEVGRHDEALRGRHDVDDDDLVAGPVEVGERPRERRVARLGLVDGDEDLYWW